MSKADYPPSSCHAQKRLPALLQKLWTLLSMGTALLLVACASPPPVAPIAPPAPISVPDPVPPLPPPSLISQATTANEYRQDAARHLYKQHAPQIYKGQLPPLMHAVGVLQIKVDDRGNISKLHWLRAPSHAPDVVQQIEHMVQAAAPFPAPVVMGGVNYTDIWLWDKSGRFQLDTLTEGQRVP